jgi:hypothetical protein
MPWLAREVTSPASLTPSTSASRQSAELLQFVACQQSVAAVAKNTTTVTPANMPFI